MALALTTAPATRKASTWVQHGHQAPSLKLWWWDGDRSNPCPPVPAKLETLSEGVSTALVPCPLQDLRHQGHLEEQCHLWFCNVNRQADAGGWSCHSPLNLLSHRFISSGIRHCFTCNLSPHLPHFSCYFMLVGTKATACLFFLRDERFGHHAILLLCTILTGISSLLLLALTQYLLDLIILISSVVGITTSHAITMLSIFFASKVLPTVVRGAGLGLVLGASFMCKALAPITAIPNSHSFLHQVVFTFFSILAILSIMLLPETQGRSLPQSLQDSESQAGPPLFHRLSHKDHMPLLIPYGIPHDYTCLTTSTKRMRLPGHPPRDVAMPPTPHQGFSTAGRAEHGAVTPIRGCLRGRWGAPGHMQWRG
ncbi:LOW QUALITY PROTEIN: putative solute carrier family 22 member 31 [Guaruba guarouba]